VYRLTTRVFLLALAFAPAAHLLRFRSHAMV
jgi:hypothetical protein